MLLSVITGDRLWDSLTLNLPSQGSCTRNRAISIAIDRTRWQKVSESCLVPKRTSANSNTVEMQSSEGTENSCSFLHVHPLCKASGMSCGAWCRCIPYAEHPTCLPQHTRSCGGSFGSAGLAGRGLQHPDANSAFMFRYAIYPPE